jgi:general secretion pathway protein G
MKTIRNKIKRRAFFRRSLNVSRGFTFLELLVVIGLIGILTVMAVVSYGSVNKRSRDARRKSDIEQLRSALEMYRADNGYYPDGPSTFTAVSSDTNLTQALASYVSTFPKDPKDDVTYPYQIIMNDERASHYYGYCLAANTELDGSGANLCGINLPTPYTYGMKNP